MNSIVSVSSLRRLAGLLVIVPWLPAIPGAVAQTPLQTGLHAWFKADAGVTVTGGSVTAWTDQTANGFILVPPATGPVLTAASVNGLPALTFDGTRQLGGSLGAGALGDATVFAIFRTTVADSDNDYLYTLGAPGTAGSQLTLSRRPGQKAYHYDGSAQFLSAEGLMPAAQWFVSSQVFGARSATSHDLFFNGAAVMRTDSVGNYNPQSGTFVIGNWTTGATRFVGDLVELLVYDRALTEAERRSVEEYLRNRAGLPANFEQEAEILSGWEVIQYELNGQPDAQWTFDLGGTRADQAINCDASILLSDINVANQVIWGKCGSGTAPDFMGFVFGYQDRGHFYLFDWKKTTDSYLTFGTAPAGMRLRSFHVAEGDPSGRDFWAADDAARVTVLRQNNLVWAGGIDYDFSLRFTPGSFVIRIWQGDTVLETWTVEDPTYLAGRFGYFVNSLQNVRFGQVFAHPLAPVTIRGFERQGSWASEPFQLRWIGGEPPFPGSAVSSLAAQANRRAGPYRRAAQGWRADTAGSGGPG
ncbi:MAG: hypothetical protein MUF04_05620 [Akkermansiaceae bacterium]|nr:hypothetical protein [Akkermansiaceae bacterium]